jgi:hypothetical protein
VFYTPSTILVNGGDVIKGTLSCAPNQRNNRDLDISIKYTPPREPEVKMDYRMCVILAPLFSISSFLIVLLVTNADRLSGLDTYIRLIPLLFAPLTRTRIWPPMLSYSSLIHPRAQSIQIIRYRDVIRDVVIFRRLIYPLVHTALSCELAISTTYIGTRLLLSYSYFQCNAT